MHLRRIGLSLALLLLALPLGLLSYPESAQAAATMYVGGATTAYVGQDVSITVSVNTGGDSANAFDATFSYPTNLFEGVRGTYAGSVCTLPITSADPSGGTATISCGRPSGYNGTGLVATIVLKALAAGTANINLSGCQVLKNDGLGTNITGGCTDGSVTISNAPTNDPTPTPSSSGGSGGSGGGGSGNPGATGTANPKNTATPKPGATPTPTPTPGGPAVGADSATTPEPTPSIEGPAASEIPDATPTPEAAAPQTESRSIAQALRDVLNSFKELSSASGNMSGIIALFITMIPVLLIFLAILFLGYRLYLLERRRRRTLDRLFELELAELASLEGKLDLLAEKGAKGRQQFKDEFQAVKENILRQIKPDYNRPVDKPKATPAEKPAEESK